MPFFVFLRLILFEQSTGIVIALTIISVKKWINTMNINTASNINAASMFTELQTETVQAKGINTDQTAKISNPTNTAPANFSAMLKQAIENVNGLQQNTAELRNGFEMGDQDISLSDVMIASNKSSLAFDATVQVRNKMVEAYKEIMSMPV